MFNVTTNEISFPHVIPGDKFGGKKHTFNSINGGMKKLADMNLIRNRFLGGNVEILGLINEYGVYVCPHFENKRVLGFYIDDPAHLTDEGKEALKERYPNVKLLGVYTGNLHKTLTESERKKKAELIFEAMERGAIKAQVERNTIAELDGLIKAMDSGKATTVQVEESKESTEDDAEIKHTRARPAQSKNRKQTSSRKR